MGDWIGSPWFGLSGEPTPAYHHLRQVFDKTYAAWCGAEYRLAVSQTWVREVERAQPLCEKCRTAYAAHRLKGNGRG